MSIQDVPPQHEFWLLGGKRLKNIAELSRELRQMKPETFAHHVNEQKNDFANWVENCVKDKQLANQLRTTQNKENMTIIIERKIQELTIPKPQPKQEPKKQPEIPKPSIIRTKNITPVIFKPKIIKTPNITPLIITQKPKIIKTENVTKLEVIQPKKIVNTPNKTQLKLIHEPPKTEIYVHEVKTHHHAGILLVSHIILGVVMGVALAAIILMLS